MIINGDCLDELNKLDENSVDAIVTDPPYELNFMGKGWDNVGVSFNKDTWGKCLRVLKPGGYLLAFGGTRTYHRIACAIEDAGFEIRDCIMWLYGSGFPKSMNISKGIEAKEKYGKANTVAKRQIEQDGNGREYKVIQTNNGAMGEKKEFIRKEYAPKLDEARKWQGWGTCLKPSYEPIIVARKPFKGSLVDNVMEYGVGGLNIDECRIAHNEPQKFTNRRPKDGEVFNTNTSGYDNTKNHIASASPNGRFPANTILDTKEGEEWRRYFYCAKASKKDRDEGLDEYEEKTSGQLTERKEGSAGITAFTGSRSPKRNTHPTVKPTALMQYLIRLVAPKGATILDPFMGSGSTGKAVMYENKERNANYKFIGIEKDAEYCKIAEARIKNAELEK